MCNQVSKITLEPFSPLKGHRSSEAAAFLEAGRWLFGTTKETWEIGFKGEGLEDRDCGSSQLGQRDLADVAHRVAGEVVARVKGHVCRAAVHVPLKLCLPCLGTRKQTTGGDVGRDKGAVVRATIVGRVLEIEAAGVEIGLIELQDGGGSGANRLRGGPAVEHPPEIVGRADHVVVEVEGNVRLLRIREIINVVLGSEEPVF